jgi:hypothetical protein
LWYFSVIDIIAILIDQPDFKRTKGLKNLKRENLRDHITDAELVFTALAELSTRQIAETMQTKGLEENKIPAKKGERVAKNARLELEQKTSKPVISGGNFKKLPKWIAKQNPRVSGDFVFLSSALGVWRSAFLIKRIRRKSQVSSPLYGGFEHSLVR